MLNKEQPEYKTVMGLFEDGRITAEERDSLLDALGIKDGDAEYKGAPSGGASVDPFESEDVNTNGEPDPSSLSSVFDKLNKKIKVLGKEISVVINKGAKTARNAIEAAGDSLQQAFSRSESGNVEKTKTICYEQPYEEMIISVTYVGDGRTEKLKKSAKDIAAIKERCVQTLDAPSYDKLCSLLDERFTGKYKSVKNGIILKVSVKPDDETDKEEE